MLKTSKLLTFLFWGHLPNKASKLIQPSIHHLSYLSMVWKPQKYTPPKLPRKPRNKKTIGKKNDCHEVVLWNFSIITLSPPWDVNDVNMINRQRCQNLKSWRQAFERGVCWYLWNSLIYIDILQYEYDMYIHTYIQHIYIHLIQVYFKIIYTCKYNITPPTESTRVLDWKGPSLGGFNPKVDGSLI